MTPRILVIGDVIDDVVVVPSGPIRVDTDTPSTIRRVAGGSAANTAAWLASLGDEVSFVGCVNAADVARHTALLPGVNVHLTASGAPTGTIVILVDGEHRSMLTERGANAELDLGAIDDALIGDHVHLTGHTMAASDGTAFARFIARAKSLGATVSVSPGSAAYIADLGAERFTEVIAGADVLFASLAEGAALTAADRPAEVAEALGFGTVVLTLGRDGVLVDGHPVSAVPAEVVDPTGAGDALCAGFLASWVRDGDVLAAGRRGVEVAARAVGVIGGRPQP
ncbi:carbohydrate kinase family protein [Leifsonia sp. H3M29-4]|uniref:carbohydrate kinase family protein n=1 Tax=Salinibacterium metalliresistens TaxID=3031321 RepID=UPI0023DB8CA0|nr:carbohydrate kinase family protein [Salinibacterium metalliresistens]MDF1477925.1 carbohydrate kinase family protein [Salinibacterium metalliresistens]